MTVILMQEFSIKPTLDVALREFYYAHVHRYVLFGVVSLLSLVGFGDSFLFLKAEVRSLLTHYSLLC